MTQAYIIVSYILTFSFVLTALRQYGSKMFHFFLILGLTGISGQILYYLKINPNIAAIAGSHMVLFFFHHRYFSRATNALHLTSYAILSTIVYFYLPFPYIHIYFILLHFCIIAFILNRALLFIHKYLEVRIFHVVLLLYEISVLGKYLSLVMDQSSGIYYFVITNIFEIFIAVFFMIVREEKSRLVIRLTNNRELVTARLDTPYFKRWDI